MPAVKFTRSDYACMAAFLAYSASAVYTPICLVVLSEELSFGLVAGGFVEVVRSTGIFLVLLVSGWFAAHWGKSPALGISVLLLGMGLIGYSMTSRYLLLLPAMAMIGVGGGMIEGLVNPLVQEHHSGDSGRYLNIINGFWSIGVLLTVLVAGEFLTRGGSWRTLAWGLGLFCLVPALLFRGVGSTIAPLRHRSPSRVFTHKWAILRHPRFPRFALAMLLAGAIEGGLTFWIASYMQLHLRTLPRAGGIGTACFAGGMILGRFSAGIWVEQSNLRRLIRASAGAGALVSAFLPFASSPGTVFGLFFLCGVSVACFWPSLQSYAADCLDVESTSLFILLSCAGIPGFGGMAWLMGWVGAWTDLSRALFLIPAAFLSLLLVLRHDPTHARTPPLFMGRNKRCCA